MGTEKLQQDLNTFYRGMVQAQKILDNFSVEFSGKLDSIGGELDSLATMTKELRCPEDLPAAKLLNCEIDVWTKSLQQCSASTKANVTGRNFQNRFEKYPLVIVFGIVKAGKSTLGNFLHGRAFRAASFDNVYKSDIPKSEIIVEESGRKDATRKEEFDENSIESTCSAQYFQIPGLAWVDTPGIGAIQKSSDLRPLEEIAKQYVRYADLVVFLSSSDHPEVIESIFGYQDLYKEGKKLLIAITRSDTHISKPNLVTKKIDKKLVPKSMETRKLQENSLLNSLKKTCEIQGLDAVSVSTLLAENAVANQDDNDWIGSNMGVLYEKIIDVIGNKKILDLKKEAPKKLLNSSIDSIVGKGKETSSLTSLINSMKDVRNRIDQKYEQLSPQGELVSMITEDVVNQLRSTVRKYAERVSKEGENAAMQQTPASLLMNIFQGTGMGKEEIAISLADLQQTIQNVVITTLEGHIIKLVGEYHDVQYGKISTTGLNATAQHRKDVHSYQVKVARSVERDPEGFVENVKHFFGKKYYKMGGYETETRTIDIDLGVDTISAKKQLLEQLEQRVASFVQTELQSIREQFFGEAQKKMEVLIGKLDEMKSRLEKLRY